MFNVVNFIGMNSFLFIFKAGFIALSFLFTIFLLVVFKQLLSMNTVVNDASDFFVLKSTSLILIILSFSLFLAAIVIL